MENAGLKNLKNFLLQYNKISESCFLHCVNHLSHRDLSQDEYGCVDICTKKFVRVNHKVMQSYMEIQPEIINKRIEDINQKTATVNIDNSQKTATVNIDNSQKTATVNVENIQQTATENVENSQKATVEHVQNSQNDLQKD